MRLVLLELYDVNRSLLTLFYTGIVIIAKFYVMKLFVQMVWCQVWWNVTWWISCSASTLVSSSWETKIVLFGPGLCWQWKTIPSPILVVAFSMLFDVSPELVIWPMDWIEVVLCVIICLMSCRSSYYFVCIPKILFGSSVQEYQVVFNWYFSYFMPIFCSLTCELEYIVCGTAHSSSFVLILVQIVPLKTDA